MQQEPWKTARDPQRRADLESTLYAAAEGLRVVAWLIAPVVPGSAARLWRSLGLTGTVDQPGLSEFAWGGLEPGSRIERGAALFPRIDKAAFLAGQSEPQVVDDEKEKDTMISIDDFFKTELKVATVVNAERIPKSRKLIKLGVEVGDESRTLVAGIAEAYEPEDLIGKQVVIVANLQPAKLMGVESQGMVLAASVDGKPVLVHPGAAVPSGTQVR